MKILEKIGDSWTRHAIVKFQKLFLPVVIVVFTMVLDIYVTSKKAALEAIHSSEQKSISVGVTSIEKILHSVTSDLGFLVKQHTMTKIAPAHSEEAKNLEKDWLAFSLSKGVYDQIRWMDHTGQEKARVNYNKDKPVIIPKQELQDKSKRYYFADALKLNEGEFFISPLDLNIEKGKIEQPIKPMIRIGTPVFDESEQKQGVLLLNYRGERILTVYKESMGDSGSRAWMLNRDGYWLKGTNPEMEWGFMYKNRENSMRERYPEAWKKIVSEDRGQFVDEYGLWTFSTIYPLVEGQKTSSGTSEAFSSSLTNLEFHDYYWKSVLFLPEEQYQTPINESRYWLLIISTLIILGYGYSSWRLAKSWVAEERAEAELKKINEGLEHIVERRTKELKSEIQTRIKTENELRENEERFRSITSTSSVAMIITVNDSGNIVTWNPAAERGFGYSELEMLGEPLVKIIPSEYQEEYLRGLEQAVNREDFKLINKTVELAGLNKLGVEFPIEFSLGTWKQSETRYFSAVVHDISDRKKIEDELRHFANHDVLTGLPTRRLCLDRIEQAIESARRDKKQTAVLFIDLDGFKSINDTMGHEAGDALLVDVAKRLSGCLRAVDTVARIGGDEFVVVLFDIAEKIDIDAIATKIVESISSPFQLSFGESLIGCSIGISVYPDDADTPEELLKLADSSMYSVKNSGKNNYLFV